MLAGHAHWHAALHQQFCTIIVSWCLWVWVRTVCVKCLCEMSELRHSHFCEEKFPVAYTFEMLHGRF